MPAMVGYLNHWATAAHGCLVGESLSFEFHAGDSTILLGSTPISREGSLGVVRGLPPLTRGLVPQRLFRVPPCREGTVHLQTSMPSPGFKPWPNGTAVSVIPDGW
ncbi:hypothetical protein TNCV_1642361 [Trichonephila clavipes]|nr:hypothetical protein TNCV_1642361 [Trichonephila clavipes]